MCCLFAWRRSGYGCDGERCTVSRRNRLPESSRPIYQVQAERDGVYISPARKRRLASGNLLLPCDPADAATHARENSRTAQTHVESSIGAWQLCLEMIGVVACLTNLLFAVLVSENVSAHVPKSMTEQLGSFEGKVCTAVVTASYAGSPQQGCEAATAVNNSYESAGL